MKIKQDVLDSIWKALCAPQCHGYPHGVGERLKTVIKTGWLFEHHLEGLFNDADRRLSDYAHRIDLDDLIEALDLRWTDVTHRPRLSSNYAAYHKGLPIEDLAYLLLELEALGFATDATALLKVLTPVVRKKAILTARELELFWSSKVRGKTIRQYGSEAEVGPRPEFREGVLPSGHKYDVVLRADGSVFTLEIRGPKHRHQRRPVETKCPECGETWYRGDPDSSRSHRKIHRKRMAYLAPQPNTDMVAALVTETDFELVRNTSPRWKQEQMYDRALAFKREMGFDFVQWGLTHRDDDDTNPHGFLFTRQDGTILGAASFRWRDYPEMEPPYWALQWIWVAPPFRRSGLVAARWPMLRDRFGDFCVESPVSEAMQAFLAKHSDEHLMHSPKYR